MDLNQVSFMNKLYLNMESPAENGITLNKGELLRGQVQSVAENGLILLMIKGKMIEAATEVMVRPGQQLFFMVDDVKDGKTFLRVVSPQEMNNIERSNIAVNLQKMGISTDDETVTMALKLLENRLPVTQENLALMKRFVAFLGAKTDTNIDLSAYALARGVTGKEGLLALNSFIQGENRLPQLVQTLQSLLASMGASSSAQANTSDEPASTIRANQAMPAQAVPEQVMSQTDGAVKPSSLSGGTLLNAAESNSPPLIKNLENKVSQAVLIQNSENGVNQAAPQTKGMPSEGNVTSALERNISLLPPALRENPAARLLEAIILSISLREEEISLAQPQKLQMQNSRETTIIRAVELLQDLLENERLPVRIPELKDLPLRLEQLEREVAGQRMINSFLRNPVENNPQYFYFSFPVQIDEQYRSCELMIQRENNKRLQDLDQIRFIVSLDTIHLGMVLFHVTWSRSREIALQGVVETQAGCDFMNENMNLLIERLDKIGYHVKNMGMHPPHNEEDIMLRPTVSSPQSSYRPIGIDLRI